MMRVLSTYIEDSSPGGARELLYITYHFAQEYQFLKRGVVLLSCVCVGEFVWPSRVFCGPVYTFPSMRAQQPGSPTAVGLQCEVWSQNHRYSEGIALQHDRVGSDLTRRYFISSHLT